jgi:uncharacterized protein (DUF58 family)
MSGSAQARSWPARWRQRIWRRAPGDIGTVVLRHRRIYILPTRRGLALIGTLVIMLVASMNYGLALGFGLTFLAGGLVASSLLQTYRNLAGVSVSPLAAGEAFAGSELMFSLSFGDPGSARHGIVVTTADGRSQSIDLVAGAARIVQLSVPAPRRGRQALGRVTLSTDFALGLWRGWAYVHFPLDEIVYPTPEAPAPALPPGREGSDARLSARAAEAELAGLRDYQRGDALNRIAWKAVARGAGWYSKQFEGAGGRGPIDLDWSELPSGLDVEARLSRLAAWALEAERETRAFALKLPGTDVSLGQGAAHRRAALAALALFPAQQRS